MEPNFHNRQVVLVQRFSYANNKEIKRGDVVAAKFPADPNRTRLIKRVIGLPGEKITVKGDNFYINGELLNEKYGRVTGEPPYTPNYETVLRPGEYYLSGDNRPGSSDSRLWGAIQRGDIQGKISFIIFPFSNLEYVGN
jgi:signal peptidase I